MTTQVSGVSRKDCRSVMQVTRKDCLQRRVTDGDFFQFQHVRFTP